MTEKKIESSNYSTATLEHRLSPIIDDSLNESEVFHTTRNLSHSNMNLSHEQCTEDYYSSPTIGVNNNRFSHLEASQRSLSMDAIDQFSTQNIISTDIHQYPLNQDPYPEHIRRQNNDRITYKQDIAIRYLQPPTPPPPGPVIVREIRAPEPPIAPPLVIHQRPPVPPTPPPIIIRERPPMPPPIEPPRVVNKYLPGPPPPPRKVIIERQAPLPPKPSPVIIEKWLPYRPPPERRVVVERAQPIIPRPPQRNTVITYDAPSVVVVKNIRDLGTVRVDPRMYVAQYGSQLASNEYVLTTMQKFGIGNNYAQMLQMQSMNSSLHNQQAMNYEESSTSNISRSESGEHCNSIERHVEEARLSNENQHVHSNFASSNEQEVLRQGTTNRQFSPSSTPGSRPSKFLPGQASPSSHHPTTGSGTPSRSPARPMNPSLSK